MKMTILWIVALCGLAEGDDGDIIDLMMEAASTSETSVNVYQTTRRNNTDKSSSTILFVFHCAFRFL
jgi:hypothetical protein